MFSFSPLVLAEVSLSVFFSEVLGPWWDRFSEVFVGEDLLIQLGCVAGAVMLAYVLVMGLKPFFKKMEGQPSNSLHVQTLEDAPSAPPSGLVALLLNVSGAENRKTEATGKVRIM